MPYRHGKRSNLPPKPRYIEDRVLDLERDLARLATLLGKYVQQEHAKVLERITQIDTDIAEMDARRKKQILERVTRKPVAKKRKRP